MTPLPLTRTAYLADYACASVAEWQQCFVEEAYAQWCGAPFIEAAGAILCCNWGAAAFRAPGPSPIYRTYIDRVGRLIEEDAPPLSVIYALSVLDRVETPIRFLRQQADRLRLGGLLICTFAAWNACGPDCAIGHELRARIYDHESWCELIDDVRRHLPLQTFGGVNLKYRGDTLGDHTLATLTLVKMQKMQRRS